MIRKSTKIIALGLVSTLAAVYMNGSLLEAKERISDTPKEKLEAYIKFTQILNIIEKEYVDEVNTTTLVNKALKGLLTNLDAHSAYMDTKSFKELDVQTKGEFGGLGISVGMRDGVLTVIAPLRDTPAYKAGIKAGDIILKIDDKATLGMTIDEAVNLMRGKPGTEITLTIVRKNEPKPLKIKIVRDIIKIQSVFAKTLENEKDILYIYISNFDSKVVKSVKEAVKKHPDAKGYIIDLRSNPGGLLDQAVKLVDMFVDKGVIVSQKGRDPRENTEYEATAPGTDKKTPLVVLVDGGSASASEIVSGALQDFKRAVVVGEKTFGKGSVQIVIPVGKNEALKLTVARYYLPSGRTIQNKGVTPDIIVHSGKIDYVEDQTLLKEKDLKKHLQAELAKLDGDKKEDKKETDETEKREDDNATKKNENVINESMLYKDAQLKSAVDILKALIITKGK
jgi:carboxyl-terminal processing protease